VATVVAIVAPQVCLFFHIASEEFIYFGVSRCNLTLHAFQKSLIGKPSPTVPATT
jgi:hypothetical protein